MEGAGQQRKVVYLGIVGPTRRGMMHRNRRRVARVTTSVLVMLGVSARSAPAQHVSRAGIDQGMAGPSTLSLGAFQDQMSCRAHVRRTALVEGFTGTVATAVALFAVRRAFSGKTRFTPGMAGASVGVGLISGAGGAIRAHQHEVCRFPHDTVGSRVFKFRFLSRATHRPLPPRYLFVADFGDE